MRVQSLRTVVFPVIALLVAGAPLSAAAQPPTPRDAAAPPPVGGTPRPVEAAPTPDATAAAAAQNAARDACEARARAVLGSEAATKAVKESDVLGLGRRSAELVICSAVLNDSADICKRYFPNEQGPSGACRQTQAIFHELRTEPKKRTFMFTEQDWQQCRGIKEAQGFCDGLRAALQSGNVDECTKAGDGEGICRAYMTLDKEKCAVTGALAEVTFSLPDRKEGEPESYKVGDIAAEDCRNRIDSRAFLAQGLEALAASGPKREQILARAALKQPDACAPRVEEAVADCLGAQGLGEPAGGQGAGAPVGGGAPAGDAAPAAPKP